MMMIGTMRINVIVAALAGLFTFALSIGNNLFLSTCLKSTYSFLILFVLTFGFRWVLGVMIGAEHAAGGASYANPSTESSIGQSLDMSTPDEDEETRELMKANLGSNNSSLSNEMQFSPLNPPKLVTKNNLDPEQLAGALRRMSED
ncbi:hypothetical protein M5X11_09780 [Paenibacillus alginolyticus]|uniref:Uncharacterized protein n=1 Tax=Paenibacillus alginolyticus TaxID=59839 RepID=A0ABT4GPE1_9BACL|nr:hypothetical protein [Paenibacillus alginolyticus]MCY9665248.1 hypothetical protein [Paenibacillus alginolyticus]MCY9698081.1 hypothetical protein [Paenibacillus alginolyticus]MEC0143930.1 hypothetical protein [Paenibacillus alginolyticus]